MVQLAYRKTLPRMSRLLVLAGTVHAAQSLAQHARKQSLTACCRGTSRGRLGTGAEPGLCATRGLGRQWVASSDVRLTAELSWLQRLGVHQLQHLICADGGALQPWLWGLHILTCRERRQYALPVAPADAARQAASIPCLQHCEGIMPSSTSRLSNDGAGFHACRHLMPWPHMHTLLAVPQHMTGLVRRHCLSGCPQ